MLQRKVSACCPAFAHHDEEWTTLQVDFRPPTPPSPPSNHNQKTHLLPFGGSQLGPCTGRHPQPERLAELLRHLASKVAVLAQQQEVQKSNAQISHPSMATTIRPLISSPSIPTSSPPLHHRLLSSPHARIPLRVAYQASRRRYSEAAAGKATPTARPSPATSSRLLFRPSSSGSPRAVLPSRTPRRQHPTVTTTSSSATAPHRRRGPALPVHHCLLALPGVRKEYLTRVISHPQALSQCELTLTKLGLNVIREAVDDTAGAAEFVAANNLRDTAAIASARAADLYGLQILADGIQDDSSNVTRFVMLAREPIIPRTDRPFKTSIVFAHDKGTSVLFKVLSAFAFRNISLTKIESRPHRNRPIRLVDDANVGTAKHFEYMFYVDFEASMAEVRAQNALAEVQEFTSFLRVLGSYPWT
ncbi:Prephenate dehydratase [Cinnamomum micranthum f. kanehirae]|uniref:Arogenate dehydratase n=1 Tax=Cinnamomum micranthum f. kanehirae TaxID=337451 RepID=A0A3S3MNW5_9MAGN|nr:Prephenate dehydratase [Cinnamomum micranthum f. kanehirae]